MIFFWTILDNQSFLTKINYYFNLCFKIAVVIIINIIITTIININTININ